MSPEVGDRPESWPVHRTESIWQGAAPFSVHRDHISAPHDPEEQFGRLVLKHPGAAVVLAIDNDDQVLVLQQYRHPARMRFVELPAGLLDVEDEDPLLAAQRELREEALLVAESWSHLTTMYPSPGLSSERIEIFLAREVSEAADRGGFEPAHEEADMTSAWVPLQHLVDGVLSGELTDGPLALAVLTYVMRHGNGSDQARRTV